MRCKASLLPEYLNFCLGSKSGRDYCWSVKSDGVSQSNINAKKLASFTFKAPSLAEQTEIVRRVETLFSMADRIEQRNSVARAHAQRLTGRMLAKAFRGELVPQDPNDDPASGLRARIVAERASTSSSNNARKQRAARLVRPPKEPGAMAKSRHGSDDFPKSP